MGREEFRISTFLTIIDSLLVHLRKRLTSYEEYKEKFYFLDGASMKNMTTNDVKEIAFSSNELSQ